MSTTMTGRRSHENLRAPLTGAAVGFTVYMAAILSNEYLYQSNDLAGAPETTITDWLAYVGIAAAGAAVAVWAGHRALAGSADRLSKTALVLSLVAAATFVVFWAGWSNIFAAVAIVITLEHRRRIGSLSATAAISLVLSSVAFVAAAVTCVVG